MVTCALRIGPLGKGVSAMKNFPIVMNGKKAVYTVTERDGKNYWTKIGEAFVNVDGSINVRLQAFPVNGTTLQVRDEVSVRPSRKS